MLFNHYFSPRDPNEWLKKRAPEHAYLTIQVDEKMHLLINQAQVSQLLCLQSDR